MGAPRSTYICPLSSSVNTGVPIMQILAVLLDCYLLVVISGLANTAEVGASPKSNNSPVVLGCIFLVNLIEPIVLRSERCSANVLQLSSVILFISGTIALGTNRIYWVELFGVDWSYTGSLAWQAVLSTVTVVAALHIVCGIP